MLYDLQVWLGGLLIAAPIVALVAAWARIRQFYPSRLVRPRHERLYILALALASVSSLGYLGSWAWWTANLYSISIPIRVSLMLERFIRAGVLLSAAATGCLLIGRGPYRVLLVLTTLLMMAYLWSHIHLLHWA